MKKQKRKKMSDLKSKDLANLLDDTRKEALRLKMEIKSGKHKDLHAFAKKRKEVARILTKQRENQLQVTQKTKEESDK